ncbi:MAG: phosphate transport regulator, partial [Thauera sp.]|nr:phosphate transport regulator [Thauera sp.]
LQTAQGHADRPDGAAPALRIERQAAGIDDEALDGIVAESRRGEGNLYRIPRVQGICTALYQDLQRMLEPIQAAGSPEWGGFAARLKLLAARPWCQADDLVSGEQIAAMTSGERERADSLHLLVMDLHKGLNALQARIATETIDGAQAYDIAAADRALIGAFMRGINQT